MFAWRRPDCAAIPQFEVDHPATQRSKQRRVARLGLAQPAAHHFVPVDFERDTASERLREAGFSTTIPTVFAWLGVTYYLTRASIEASLRDIRSIAAPGSYLVFDYRMADHYLLPRERGPVFRADAAFKRWGEPMLSRLEPDDLHAVLRATGWHVEHEHTASQLAARYFSGGRDGLVPASVYRVIEATPA
jgi:methyltransferase (TIGR00027 family)